VVMAVVDVSSVRNILSQIRRVVTGDIILPEDHNLQTNAVTELTNIVEAIQPTVVPIMLHPAGPPGPLQGSYDYEYAPFMIGFDAPRNGELAPGFPMPFQVTLKKLIVRIDHNNLDATGTISAFHDETNEIATISIPAGDTGLFIATINDYVIPENGRIAFYIDLRASSDFVDTTPRFMDVAFMYLLGVVS
jgi:hypothetical protein